MSDDTTTDTDKLPLTQQLVLEVLAARYRLGEKVWTFSAATRRALDALEELRLVHFKSGVIERTYLVWLTDAGKLAVLDPNYKVPREALPRHSPDCTLCY